MNQIQRIQSKEKTFDEIKDIVLSLSEILEKYKMKLNDLQELED